MPALVQAWLFERTPSEASSMGLPRQHSRRHGAPHGAALTPARQPQPNVSRSSMLLCKFSSSALSKITAGSSRWASSASLSARGQDTCLHAQDPVRVKHLISLVWLE